jgi:hypothetical protein
MTIAFIHYHLKPGGVTRVIQQQIGICEQMGWEHCVLAGENPQDMPGVRIIQELHYDLHRRGLGSTSGGDDPSILLADQIEAAIRSAFGCAEGEPDSPGDGAKTGPCADILHVHNATLAKNSDLLPALRILRSRGNRLFLQLHDFAEDGRPTVYSCEPYPGDAHYGYINSRDGRNLAAAGVAPERLHAIPNLISPLPGAIGPEEELPAARFVPRPEGPAGQSPGSRRFALYPVRGIRRKNLGETLLLSLLCDDIEIGITLEPNNPADLPSYRFWEGLAGELGAPVRFNIARDISFEKALERAEFFISTSVQEGFGFAFLEPWTLGKPVAGRRIPYVHKDFVAEGMDMDRFYDQIPVPSDAVDIPLFRGRWLEEAERRLSRFRIALRNQDLHEAADKTRELTAALPEEFHRLYGNGTVDFGRLDPENQAAVLRRAAADGGFRATLRDTVPELSQAPYAGSPADCERAVRANHRQVYRAYGEARYAARLEAIYRSVLQDSGPGASGPADLDKRALLFSFLDPSMIFLVSSL